MNAGDSNCVSLLSDFEWRLTQRWHQLEALRDSIHRPHRANQKKQALPEQKDSAFFIYHCSVYINPFLNRIMQRGMAKNQLIDFFPGMESIDWLF
jgi:hypothetical protein